MKIQILGEANSIELEEPKKINIFVGKEATRISQIMLHLSGEQDTTVVMYLGMSWHYSQISEELLSEIKFYTNKNFKMFAFVQSLEIAQSLPKAVRQLDFENDFRLTRIDRKSEGLKATNYTLEVLEASIDSGWEFR